MHSLGEGVMLEGFTAGETWNGWDCPYFTFEQAQLGTFSLKNLADGNIVPALKLASFTRNLLYIT